jgi:GNAT superfamily N-acetyltransferase
VTALAAALHFRRELRRRAATETTALAHGLVIRHEDLPDVPDLNAVHLDAAAARLLDAAEVYALAEQWLGDLPYRHLVIDDAAAGERIAAALADDGWRRRRLSIMVLQGSPPPADAAPPVPVRLLPEPDLHAIQLAALREEAPVAAVRLGVVDQLARGAAALRAVAGGGAAGFGAEHDGTPASSATLFTGPNLDGRRMAMIEEVGTLRGSRERGLGAAVVRAAAASALKLGASPIVVPVDADDWPQMMYAKLGFATVGGQTTLMRPSTRRNAL